MLECHIYWAIDISFAINHTFRKKMSQMNILVIIYIFVLNLHRANTSQSVDAADITPEDSHVAGPSSTSRRVTRGTTSRYVMTDKRL